MLFQFPHPLLTDEHQEILHSLLINAIPQARVTFYPPFGIFVTMYSHDEIKPYVNEINNILMRASEAWLQVGNKNHE